MVQRFKNWRSQPFNGSIVQRFNGSRSEAVPDVSNRSSRSTAALRSAQIKLLQQFSGSIIQHFRDRSRSMVEQLTMSGL
jgi:hypothetical protein